ncbi:MAG: hypothetical protein IPK79_02420 [Vampirovibrionales bacterium]|nr:hypothetical protein [Vampirovibrionales bacterium]
MSDRISKETRLDVAKSIVANYVRGDNCQLSPDEVCAFLEKVFHKVNELLPSDDQRKVGLS